jgi:pSer/pThr/pTyr-binding forkhead associated (FHA) protein
MARLILSLDNQVLAEYNMTKERYTIGRLPDNDVRIDNPAVSGHHSLIINILNDSFLEDLNSTNGTYVNGKLIKKHALQHGDVITIGHHQLRFSDQQAPETEQDEFEKTMVIPTGQQNADQLAKAEAAAEQAAAAAAAEEAAAAEPAPREDVAAAGAAAGAGAGPRRDDFVSHGHGNRPGKKRPRRIAAGEAASAQWCFRRP